MIRGLLSLGNQPAATSPFSPAFDRDHRCLFYADENLTIEIDARKFPFANIVQHGEDVVVSLVGRIDNWSQLHSKYSQDQPLIILADAFSSIGPEIFSEIKGDWSLVIWNKKKRTLWITRDKVGCSEIYYTQYNGFLHFSSSLTDLVTLSRRPPQINRSKICEIGLTVFSHDYETGFNQYYRIPSAHSLAVRDGNISKFAYWTLGNAVNKERSPRRSPHETVDEFIALYKQSVANRLQPYQNTGITLSGGLDSGSVAALAASLNPSKRFHAFTHVPTHSTDGLIDKSRIGNEYESARKLQEIWENICITPVSSPSQSLIASLKESLAIDPQPAHGASNLYWLLDIFKACQGRSCDNLLTGQAGNFTVSWTGRTDESGWPMLARGDISWLPSIERIEPRTILRVLKNNIIKPLIPPLISEQLKSGDKAHITEKLRACVLNRDFLQRTGFTEAEALSAWKHRNANQDSRINAINSICNFLPRLWHSYAQHFNVATSDPTLDEDLLLFLLSLPNSEFYRHGQTKCLIRSAMQGYMPASTLLSKAKGLQSSDIARRVCSQQHEFRACLADFEQHDLVREALDITRMRHALDRVITQPTPETSAQCRSILLKGTMIGLFIQKYS